MTNKTINNLTTDEVENILNSWALGSKTDEIANQAGLPTKKVYRVIHKAALNGDPRAARRRNTGNLIVKITDRRATDLIKREAKKRRLSPEQLIRNIVTIIVADGLLKAILDDEVELKAD